MKILLVHQNFPGQFIHLYKHLLNNDSYHLTIFTMNDFRIDSNRASVVKYQATRSSGKDIHPWVIETEAKVIRAEAALRAAIELRSSGYEPDLILAHPGWGESIFLKQVWPFAKLVIYCEFFYHESGADVGFDPEFPVLMVDDICKVQLKNINNFLNMAKADAGISPTCWQKNSFPEPFRSKIKVIHDGIDTDRLKPDPKISITINNKLLSDDVEIITFVNRTFEPYRGYHTFMRAIPEILRLRPNARVLLIGAEGLSYGAPSDSGKTWKQIFYDEVKEVVDSSRIHFLGALPHETYLSILKRSDVHVYLTYPFVLSWSLLEAMSVGCTIIGSDTSPVREVISHNENGMLVNFFDPKSLAEMVASLLNNPLERQRLSKNARKTIVEKYDLKNVCLPQTIEFIESICKPQ